MMTDVEVSAMCTAGWGNGCCILCTALYTHRYSGRQPGKHSGLPVQGSTTHSILQTHTELSRQCTTAQLYQQTMPSDCGASNEDMNWVNIKKQSVLSQRGHCTALFPPFSFGCTCSFVALRLTEEWRSWYIRLHWTKLKMRMKIRDWIFYSQFAQGIIFLCGKLLRLLQWTHFERRCVLLELNKTKY